MSDATLKEIWKQRDAWAFEARSGKKRQDGARKTALWFGVCGGLFGAAAGFLERADMNAVVTAFSPALGAVDFGAVFGIPGAVLIALSGYFGRELLTPDRDTRWARARVLAEALQRECWRYLMRVPPYDDVKRAPALRERAATLVANVGLERAAVTEEKEPKIPAPNSVEDYLNERVLAQAKWYETRSIDHRRQRTAYQLWTFGLGAFGVILSVIGARADYVLTFVPVVTTATAAIVAWVQATRAGSLVSMYQETATQLRLCAAAWHDGAEERGEQPSDQGKTEMALVEQCEQIMAQENGAWRAEWLSDEKAQRTLTAFYEAARVNGGQRPGADSGGLKSSP